MKYILFTLTIIFTQSLVLGNQNKLTKSETIITTEISPSVGGTVTVSK